MYIINKIKFKKERANRDPELDNVQRVRDLGTLGPMSLGCLYEFPPFTCGPGKPVEEGAETL